ncbi:Golgi resident protein GCP60 [Clarias gariepinus]|uniref:Golgi resident protein GCP60 n=1 Tax=Clarias gariepinus TaxID=13013 RepID=UPI00234C100F|nr:Golgi resident protein GCP60 [Clarias gariepinus]
MAGVGLGGSDQERRAGEESESENPAERKEGEEKEEEREEERDQGEEREEDRRDWSLDNHWGFGLEGIFGLALKFFKEMNGKAFHPTYEENLLFVALQKQIFLGPYNPKVCPEIGFFDVLGNDRRKKWAELGSTAKEDAMKEFVKLLNSCCSRFSPYVTSHKIEKEEHERRLKEEEERLRAEREERQKQEEEERRRQEAERSQSIQQKQQATVALNVSPPFRQNAQTPSTKSSEHQPPEQHSPESPQRAHHTHPVKQQDTADAPSPDSNDVSSVTDPISPSESSWKIKSEGNPKQYHLFIESNSGDLPIMAPSMWTTSQVNEFKQKTQQDAESVVTVGRGEVLTVHIPTRDDGSTFFWEFATDSYDIAFGLYFEWPSSVNGARAESVSEAQQAGVAEEANRTSEKKTRQSVAPRVSEVVPLFRGDSHENVYAGSHQYPSHGVYLLRFDNSYSLWRSKVVYYRVYYTR